MIVLLMGVSGAGKTAVGRRLAERQGWPFLDADDLHPADNVRKMSEGVPLTDEDRLPWLERVREEMEELAASGHSAVVACSALRRRYREILRAADADVRFVHLSASPEVLERRLSERPDHFFDPALLSSQLETLEPPRDALIVDADRDIEAVIGDIEAALDLDPPPRRRAS